MTYDFTQRTNTRLQDAQSAGSHRYVSICLILSKSSTSRPLPPQMVYKYEAVPGLSFTFLPLHLLQFCIIQLNVLLTRRKTFCSRSALHELHEQEQHGPDIVDLHYEITPVQNISTPSISHVPTLRGGAYSPGELDPCAACRPCPPLQMSTMSTTR